MEDSAEIVFKPITLLQSQGILFKDLTFECPFIDCSTTFSSTQFTSWVEEIKLMEFPLDVEVLKNVIRIEYIIGKALEDSSAAGFSEEQRNYWKNAHSYLSDLSKRHLKQ
ncbi:hypothetical protein NPIL_532471 [Nephila pilipes]|uniref:Uncharacterized protein n=1 Tax=Nephila pilipes TaxID=299642 RepID=A0A8X6NYH3_NEPPI|nr:hypothetical protein NPIL_51251 [Nephila pilipes]GFU04537.1 hypothetical protein NPIL_110481 [Nephila pilipes]GFU42466.1 hypothetical protein NPIL_532471 [Nephila pilipes]